MPAVRYQKHLDDPAYKAYRKWLKENEIQCWELDCVNRAFTPDHCPPISEFPDPSLWVGTFKPHCRYHSNRQGAMQRWKRHNPPKSREW